MHQFTIPDFPIRYLNWDFHLKIIYVYRYKVGVQIFLFTIFSIPAYKENQTQQYSDLPS